MFKLMVQKEDGSVVFTTLQFKTEKEAEEHRERLQSITDRAKTGMKYFVQAPDEKVQVSPAGEINMRLIDSITAAISALKQDVTELKTEPVNEVQKGFRMVMEGYVSWVEKAWRDFLEAGNQPGT